MGPRFNILEVLFDDISHDQSTGNAFFGSPKVCLILFGFQGKCSFMISKHSMGLEYMPTPTSFQPPLELGQ